tara:strand:- start:765 stop:962 length:198 start_codon:yes stop_codon:yes gene_type:complete
MNKTDKELLELAAKAASLEKLRDFVSFYANCPCCQKSDVCGGGCSFAQDDPNGFDVMQQAREALQ